MQIETITKCNLCGCTDLEIVWDRAKRDKKGKNKGSYNIRNEDGELLNGVNVACKKCGLVFVSSRVIQSDMNKYYESEYRKTYNLSKDMELLHANNVISYLNGLPEIKGKLKSLDIGCSCGLLVKGLSQHFDAYGIDQNRKAVVEAQKEGLKVIRSDLFDFDTKDRYGLVTMVNTLEHMHNVTKSLCRIHDLMAENGQLLLVVPNLYMYSLMCSVDAFFSCAHLHSFDLRTINLYLNKCGFQLLNFIVFYEPNFEKIYLVARKIDIGNRNVIPLPEIGYVPDIDILRTRLEAFDFLESTIMR